ncbi:MAG: hypothetical protein JJU29_00755 [Verrucomicrobia bacterium]|nr:hypothetical protein [Verrucomicrobiota bacterium]MCH8510444.1 hypothetical protein [Kiritimatiellia bacterium]
MNKNYGEQSHPFHRKGTRRKSSFGFQLSSACFHVGRLGGFLTPKRLKGLRLHGIVPEISGKVQKKTGVPIFALAGAGGELIFWDLNKLYGFVAHLSMADAEIGAPVL